MENGKSLALVPFTMSSVYTEGGLAPALPQSLNQFFKSPPASEPGRW